MRIVVFLFIGLTTAGVRTRAGDLFESAAGKQAFLKALDERGKSYDPNECMIRRPFSSPGYHTTLKGGYVHPTRDSFNYAVALLDSGRPHDLDRACAILRRVIGLQDQHPDSRTYGIWSWFMEEPLDNMSPPDWNWADFCGAQLLQVVIDHIGRLPPDLQVQTRNAVIHACHSIKRRDVKPGYTNIALMGTYVTLVAGERMGVPEVLEYGRMRLRRFMEYAREKGAFSEYNSPTYSVVAVTEITRMLMHVTDAADRKLVEELNRLAWGHVARHFHVPTRQWAGPHSRAYRTFLGDSEYAFIQRATGNRVRLVGDDKLYDSLDSHRVRAVCPEDLHDYFTELAAPRLEVEAFVRNEGGRHDIIGTTYLHPDLCLGTVNIGDLWNQRRPVLAYWNTPGGRLAMRIRCLHDDYDYSSASIFTVQDKTDVLGAVTFATDRGDTHISLDRIKDATIRARDLRIRLEFEGDTEDLKLPARFELGRPARIESTNVAVDFAIARAVFAEEPLKTETGRSENKAWLDVVLYSGPEKPINFAQVDQAAVAFTLTLTPASTPATPPPPPATSIVEQSTLITTWKTLSLTTPAGPAPTSEQQRSSSGKRDGAHIWKGTNLL